MNGERFLDDVAAGLTMPEPQRAEVLEELAAHLGDAIADLRDRGMDAAAAEAQAIERLGPPEDLARGLMRARETRGQLLAAAGAGVVAALRSGIPAAFAGWLIAALVAVLATVAIAALRPILNLPPTSGWTSGWNSVIAAVGLCAGSALAGAAAVRVVASRTWRRAEDVRLPIAIVGSALIAYPTLVSLRQALNWASVVAFIAVPVAFAIGTRLRPVAGERWRLLGIVSAAVLLGSLVLAAAGSHGLGEGGYEWTTASRGYSMIAPWWRDPDGPDADVISAGSGWGTLGTEWLTVTMSDGAAAAGFSDYRFEAWRSEPPQNGWPLTPGQSHPFATAPGLVDGANVAGTISFDGQPGLEWAEVVMTAVASDGRRYLLYASGPEQTEFFGSVWDWFAAVARD